MSPEGLEAERWSRQPILDLLEAGAGPAQIVEAQRAAETVMSGPLAAWHDETGCVP
jgi:hypothetical protein